jgi:hypothetical protein
MQGGEASMAGHLRRLGNGDRSYVGLPVQLMISSTA